MAEKECVTEQERNKETKQINAEIRKVSKDLENVSARINFAYENMGQVDVSAERIQQRLFEKLEKLEKELKDIQEKKTCS